CAAWIFPPFPTRRSSDLCALPGDDVTRGDVVPARAQVRREDLAVPAVRRPDLDHGHVRLEAEELQRFPRMAITVARAEIGVAMRSEEHTSELQSLRQLVC